LLGLHEVREGVGDPWAYDLAFLGVALLTFGLGNLVLRSARRRVDGDDRAPIRTG
jgi:uncharacterized membrane protein